MSQKRKNLWIKSKMKSKENSFKLNNQLFNKKKLTLKDKNIKNNFKKNNKENNWNIAKIVIFSNTML